MFNLIISIMKSTRNLKPLWLLMFFLPDTFLGNSTDCNY